MILEALRQTAAARASKHWAAAPLVILLWSYLHRVARRFESLTARLGAARLGAAHLRAGQMVARSTRPQTARSPSARPPRLPGGFAWLLRLVPEAIGLASQLQYLLADPEMAALLATEPRAGRLLRPLCRMLGLSPGPDLPAALFRLPAAPASRRPSGPPAPQERSARLEESLALPAVGAAPA